MSTISVTVNADGHAVEDASGLVVACGWFARCTRLADGTMPHPVFGDVPACYPCADVVGASDTLTPWGAS